MPGVLDCFGMLSPLGFINTWSEAKPSKQEEMKETTKKILQ